jgi:hypothetical protein
MDSRCLTAYGLFEHMIESELLETGICEWGARVDGFVYELRIEGDVPGPDPFRESWRYQGEQDWHEGEAPFVKAQGPVRVEQLLWIGPWQIESVRRL